jgi:ubiquinone/menaquinone biosynthesis C-methylase UbiE
MENEDLRKLVIDEFTGENAQRLYAQKALEGLWLGERHFIDKYFTKKGKLLDLGCGTGRTTLVLQKEGYKVIGVDITPAMIAGAKKIAKAQKQTIDYRVGDATALEFPDNTFDYALFSNQGATQIPGKENRLKAAQEAYRVLKPGGIYIFTSHQRRWQGFTWFWTKQWLRLHLLKPLGAKVDELDFGDRFFDRETSDKGKTYTSKQYIHIPAIREMESMAKEAGFELLEVERKMQIRKGEQNRYPPVFYVCKK